ncbi:MAG: hypothetical protein AAF772_13630 [Acidobacteriota bacterium]
MAPHAHDDDHVREMVNDLGRALVETLSNADDVTHAMRRIHEQGYRLQLILDCDEDGEHGLTIELASREPQPATTQPATPPPALPPARDPAFRLEGQDVAWLRELGIDATRPGRNPRRRSS